MAQAKSKANTKTNAKNKAEKRSAGKQPNRLRVRMYRVGFGDFFLVTVPSSAGPQHILIDCGVTRGRTGKGDIASIKTAVRHMAAETKGKLALIIITHRHQDHIIGFSRCAAEFEAFRGNVGAIWMSHWETEYPKVQKFQADIEALALGLRAAALAGTQDEVSEEILGLVENATGVSKEGPGGGTNKASLALLKNALEVKPEYYAKGQTPKLPAGLVESGITAEILGPPPADEFDFMRMMDLKKGIGQYLDVVTARGEKTRLMPFSPEFQVGTDAYPANDFREWAPRIPGKPVDSTKRFSEPLQKAVKNALPDTMLMAAKKLDGILNNQSLVVLFTWKGKKLLFAGDAQGGNWEYWLYDLDKPKSDPSNLQLAQEGRDVLSSLDFYKVGHHGSTNATPIAAVDGMRKDFVSMCSTQAESFGSKKNNSEVPRVPLVEALAKKCALVRSDQFPITVNGKVIPAVKGSPEKPPKPKQGSFEIGSCHVDYFL